MHDERHGISNGKEEGRKYEIRGGKAVPVRMQQGAIRKLPATRAVYNDHETNRHSPEDIQGEVASL
jgi:hypothetical protein